MPSHFRDHVVGQIERKSKVVSRGDESHRPVSQLLQSSDERHGTDWPPVVTQLIQRYMLLETFAHVLSRNSFPGDIRDITGNVIKSSGNNARLMRECQKSNARPDTRSQNADSFITFVSEPLNGGARVDDALAK